jgi:serine/threonine protein kinase
VKVIDFGVSTMMDPRKNNKKLFHKEPLKGTPHFVPPEAFK